MRLRQYREDSDFEVIKTWISDDRTHAMWCAHRFKYPLEKDDFAAVLATISENFGDIPFVAADDDDRPLGFLCYSMNPETKGGFLKFVVVDPKQRGKGVAREMLRLISEYAFDENGATSIGLRVFSENPRALKCYEKAGFVLTETEEKAFSYKDERWGRCLMIKENGITE